MPFAQKCLVILSTSSVNLIGILENLRPREYITNEPFSPNILHVRQHTIVHVQYTLNAVPACIYRLC